MAEKRFLDLDGLSEFLTKLRSTLAAKSHKHTVSDITDYTVDGTLSSTSTNPIQNKAVKSALDEKVPTSRTVNGKALSSNVSLTASDVDAATSDHTHDGLYYTESEVDSKLNEKADSTHVHDDRYYTETEIDGKLSGKADSSHNHSAADITSGTLSSDRLPSIPVGKLSGIIDSSNLPSYVDDVLEYTAKDNFPTKGETGKIYVDTATNLTYRWSGSAYVEISPSIALGETSSTAYRGDLGKIAYDHSQKTGNPHGTAIADIDGLQTELDNKSASGHTHTGLQAVTTAGDGAAYTATVDGVTALAAGANFIMMPHVQSTSTSPTLNVNGLGAKTIRVQLSNSSSTAVAPAKANFLGASKPVRMVYNGTMWVAQLIRPDASTIYGAIKVANGGTGKSSVTAGSYLVGNGTDAMTEKTAEQLYADIQSYVQAEINSAIGTALNASY